MSANIQKGPHRLPREPLTKLEPGLPAHWYNDPQHYQRELELFWYATWIAVAREEELAAARDYKVASIGTQSILIVRHVDNTLRAFHNTCRHRGSILCTEDRGRLTSERIVCPYHAWTYDMDGHLVATPRQMETPDFDRARFPLHTVAVDTWGGFVFVNLAGKDAPPLMEALDDIPAQFARHGLADLRVGRRIVLEVRANWKLLLENFYECFHCPGVHPQFCDIVPAFRAAGAWGLGGDAQPPEYKPGAKTLTLDGSARLPPFRGLTAEERNTLYVAQTFRPNLFLNVHPDYVNAHTMFPTGPESVRMVYDWLFEPGNLPMPEADLEHYVALWDLTNRQDWDIVGRSQLGISSRRYAPGPYSARESIPAAWDREYLRLMGRGTA